MGRDSGASLRSNFTTRIQIDKDHNFDARTVAASLPSDLFVSGFRLTF